MSTDATTEDAVGTSPPEKEGCLVRMLPVTTPGCASCLTALFLIATVVIVWSVFFLDPIHVPWRHAIGWPRILAILALVAAIPWVVYRTILWWSEGEPTPFPDLELAWYTGLQALTANSISITNTPLYLVIGSASEQQERSLMNASGQSWVVEGVPHGPGPLHWYGNQQSIFLFCSDTSWSSALASLREELMAEAALKGGASPEAAISPIMGGESWAPPMSTARPAPAALPFPTAAAPPAALPMPATYSATPSDSAQSSNIRGTIMLDQYVQQMAPPAAPPPASALPPPSFGSPTAHRGTISLGGPDDAFGAPAAPATPALPVSSTRAIMPSTMEASGPVPVGAVPPVLVSAHYSAVCLQQLRFIGEMLYRFREPVCPINGILSLIQVESIYATPPEIDELQKAISSDLATIQFATRLRCPVTALIVGLEKERGFQELVRRVGKERAMTQRFGRRFDVRAFATNEDLSALSTHVCGAFEDWVYVLFREDASLERPGNLQLYELLSKVRCTWKTRLGDILAAGYGCEMNEESQTKSLLFSGCYAASTGDTPDRQAFVRGVIEKLAEEQEMVEWTAEARSRQKLQQRFGAAGVAVAGALFLGLIGMVGMSVARWFRS